MNLYWTITETCQLKCRYCYYEVGTCKRHKENLDPDLFKAHIPEISKHVDTITFTGGEVLLLPYFWEIVEAARNHNVKVNFLTDGIRFDEKNLKKVLELGVRGVSVSLDSLDNDINEYQRPLKVSKNGFPITETIKRNIINASQYQDNDFVLTINQSVTRLNIQSIKPMAEFARKYNIRHLVHLAGIPEEAGLEHLRIENCLPEERYELREQMEFWANGNQGFEDYTRIAFSFLGKSLEYETICPMKKSWINVSPKGEMTACFFRSDLKFGTIFSNGIEENIKEIDWIETSCSTLGCACMLEFKL